MPDIMPLDAQSLRWRCDPAQFAFATTDELPDLNDVLGQSRAVEAVQFGVSIKRQGYNLFLLGPPGIGKRTVIRRCLEQRARESPTPPDWCYVNNFEDPRCPRAISLPAGRGVKLRADVKQLVEDLRTTVPAALERDEHKSRLREIVEDANEQRESAFRALAEKALTQKIQLLHTPAGFALAPLHNGNVMSSEEFDKLSDEEKSRIQEMIGNLQEELRQLVEQIPKWSKETRDKIKDLNRDAVKLAIGHSLAQIGQRHSDLSAVQQYFAAVEKDIIERVDEFQPPDESTPPMLIERGEKPSFDDFEINLFVDNSQTQGAPIISEDHPSYHNLIGRVEHESHMGALFTDFTLIKAGALQRANGGYLILDVRRLLEQPFAWEGLKRALAAQSVKIESLGESLSLISTVTLEPERMPIDVKVVLLGDRLLYYLLYAYDPDFAELFKVEADFDERMERTPENCQLYARLIATAARQAQLRPLTPAAVAGVLEHGARTAEDTERLSTHLQTVNDLMTEADHWAGQESVNVIDVRHVQTAIDQQIRRADRARDRIHEAIQRGILLIETQGERVAQVNGLAVLDLGNFSFGQPTRITATTRLGRGDVIDIEREVRLGSPIHSKGVLILSSYLAARFARNQPLSLSASLVFEQSYGMIDGDSASIAELCALLSSLADLPIRQSLAVTGSMNQLGQVQPIGGVNEKIEGFFDVCRARGLTGEQGVIIPAANVKHLMLRQDVVSACAAGQFRVCAVNTADEAMQILSGVPAGERDADGNYPATSVHGRVLARVNELTQLRLKFGADATRIQTNEESAHGAPPAGNGH